MEPVTIKFFSSASHISNAKIVAELPEWAVKLQSTSIVTGSAIAQPIRLVIGNGQITSVSEAMVRISILF